MPSTLSTPARLADHDPWESWREDQRTYARLSPGERRRNREATQGRHEREGTFAAAEPFSQTDLALDWVRREDQAQEADYRQSTLETGQITTPELWADRDKRAAQTELVSVRMADRLKRLGVGGYHDGEPLAFVGVHTGSVKTIPPFRRCNWIPQTAQLKRNQLLNQLIFFVNGKSKQRGIAFRHICIHDGPRCQSLHLGERWDAQNRRVRGWNRKIAEQFGAYFVFRSNEAGGPVQKTRQKVWNAEKGRRERRYIRDKDGNRQRCLDEQGRQTWHPHTHAILMLTRWLGDDEFAQMIARMKHWFGAVEPDHGILKEPREACKYLVKCDELEALSDVDFIKFCYRTKGRRLVEALGPFRQFRRELRTSGKKVRPFLDNSGEEPRVGYKVNRSWDSSALARARDYHFPDADLPQGAKAIRLPGQLPLQSPAICARIAPQTMFAPVSEPVYMVRGKRIDAAEFCARPQVAKVVEETLDDWEAGCATFEALYGVTVENWLTMGALCIGALPEFLAEMDGSPKGSAHNTPVTGSPPRLESENREPAHEPGSYDWGTGANAPPEKLQTTVLNLRQSETRSPCDEPGSYDWGSVSSHK